MPGFSPVFGTGGAIYPAQQTQISLALTANILLQWPLEQQVGGANIAAAIVSVTAGAGPFSIGLPSAKIVSNGYAILFDNLGANSYTVEDFSGNTLLTVASGEAWVIYLRDNSTDNGTWRSFQQGAGASSANAATLAGAGLKAITTTLNQRWMFNSHAVDYVLVDGDRATLVAWTGGVGTFTLPDPAGVGSDWFAVVKNAGSGTLTIDTVAGSVDAGSSIGLAPEESAFFVTDGSDWYSVGLGQDQNSIFDFVSFSVAGSGDYVLSGAQLNRVSYQLTGVLTGNRNIIVPNTVQQYWVENSTTGAFALTVKTAAGTGVTIGQGERAILYSNGTNVVLGQTAGAITFGNGSAAAPSVTFTTQATMGLYKAGTNILGVSTAGVVRATIDAEGNWDFAEPTSADPTMTINKRLAGNTGLRIIGVLSDTSTLPSIHIDAGGTAMLCLTSDGGTLGTNDFRIFQLTGSREVTMLNAAATAINLTVGALQVGRFNDTTPEVTLGATASGHNIRLHTGSQTTVGAAGGASALPATPSAYAMVNLNGNSYVIPCYAP